MGFYSEEEHDPLVHESRRNLIDARWKQLHTLINEITNDGIKYLFLSNSGAAVAMLAFIGNSKTASEESWPWAMLFCFVLGLIGVGILHLARYHTTDWLYKGWRYGVNNYYSEVIPWEELLENDEKKVIRIQYILIIPYVIFSIFIAGVGIGGYNYHTFLKKENQMAANNQTPQAPKPGSGTQRDHAHVPNTPPVAPPIKK